MCNTEYVHARRIHRKEHQEWMHEALSLAQCALDSSDVPIGALVIASDGTIIGRGYNQREKNQDPTAHAEIIALREAAEQRGQWRLEDCTLVVTIEPCIMCAGAILLSRISTVVLGAWEEKTGAAGSLYDVLRDRRYPHSVEVYSGVLEEECASLMKTFFEKKRSESHGPFGRF
ncbi:tRNA adenosine(34) deaminase TadA [Rothia sp. P7181]|uniref:tRNA adenosine(34) deaminase TadA n=1 Tax=unclassified Rothia (in: high G+C Gram-positive bacteria) TaxID=2689056 RepID=UPI003AC6429F